MTLPMCKFGPKCCRIQDSKHVARFSHLTTKPGLPMDVFTSHGPARDRGVCEDYCPPTGRETLPVCKFASKGCDKLPDRRHMAEFSHPRPTDAQKLPVCMFAARGCSKMKDSKHLAEFYHPPHAGTLPLCKFASKGCSKMGDSKHMAEFSHPPKMGDRGHMAEFSHPTLTVAEEVKTLPLCKFAFKGCSKMGDSKHMAEFSHPLKMGDRGHMAEFSHPTLTVAEEVKTLPLCKFASSGCSKVCNSRHIAEFYHPPLTSAPAPPVCKFAATGCSKMQDERHMAEFYHPVPSPVSALTDDLQNGSLQNGSVVKVASDFGFIKAPDMDDNVFFHRSDCQETFSSIKPGDFVEFSIALGPNGKSKAVSVSCITDEMRITEIKKLIQNDSNIHDATVSTDSSTALELQIGYVVKLASDFGFIQVPGNAENIFFHWSDSKGVFSEIKLGDIVEFFISTDSSDKSKAVSLVVVSDLNKIAEFKKGNGIKKVPRHQALEEERLQREREQLESERERLVAEAQAHGHVGALPAYWEHKDPKLEYTLLELSPKDEEFQVVALHFTEKFRSRVFVEKVFRIQNPILWEKYRIVKEDMEKKQNGGKILKKFLFHGSDWDACKGISRNGFDWRRSGKNAAAFGDGCYFSEDSSYSHQYACNSPRSLVDIPPFLSEIHNSVAIKKESRGSKTVFSPQIAEYSQRGVTLYERATAVQNPRCSVMLRVRVLVGKFCQGKSGLRRPPPLKPAEPHGVTYDSCVNRLADPTMYIVFEHGQAYPEHMIIYSLA